MRSPLVRLLVLPLSVAGFVILIHRGCASLTATDPEVRRHLLDKADSSFRIPVDSFLRRRVPGGIPTAEDRIEIASRKSGWPLRHRGIDSGWQWGCFQSPDSGIAVFFAFDSGCATQHGAFWSDAMAVHWQAWDLQTATGGPERHTSNTQSIWTYPGDSRMCLPTRADHPPDSVQSLCRFGRR